MHSPLEDIHLYLEPGHGEEVLQQPARKDVKFTVQPLKKPHTDKHTERQENFVLWRPIKIINSVVKSKLSCYTTHRRSTTVSLETCPLLYKQTERHMDK